MKKERVVPVRTVVNGSVYYRAWYQFGIGRFRTKEKNVYWADFEYCNGLKKLQNQKEMDGLDEKSSLHVYVLR